MKPIVISFSILMLLLPIVIAETQIFSGKVITNTDKVIDGNTFKFTYDEESDKIFVQNPATSLIINNGECKSNAKFKVCINSANFSHKNMTTYEYYYEIDATIYKLTASLSTNSTANPSTLLQGESAELAITITNPTNFDITDIVFNYDLTPFFIKEVKGCTLKGSQIVWEGSLQSKYDKICIAAIVAEQEGKYNLAGNLSYFNGFETEKKMTSSTAVTVLPKQLKISYYIDQNIETKQPFYFNMSLQNIHANEEMETFVTIELPSNIVLLKDTQGFKKDFNVLKHSSIFEPGSIKNYSFYLEAISEGKNPVKQRFYYIIKDISNTMENITFIDTLEPKPIINFSTEYAEIMPEQKFIVIAKLKNPSRIHELANIKVRLNAPYNNVIEQNLNKLMPNESYPIISNRLAIPKNADLGLESGNKTISLNLSIEYKFYEFTKSLNKSLELRIKQETINGTANITTIKSDIQIPQETKIQETKAESQSDNKTEQITMIIEKPKIGFFNKKTLKIGGVIFTVIIVIIFILKNYTKPKHF